MHATNILGALSWSLGALVIYLIVSSFLRNRRYAAEALRRGCKPPPQVAARYPLGIDHITLALEADRDKRFAPYIMSRFERIGGSTLRYSIMGTETLQTIDPKNIQAMLATQFNDFSLGARRRNNFLPLLGNGIFTLDGKGWEHSRAMLRPQFARDQISNLELEEKHVQNMMQALPVDGQGWIDTDLNLLFFRLTLDSATEFLFGESVDSQLNELPGHEASDASRDSKLFASAFDLGQSYLATRSRLQTAYWLLNPSKFQKACTQTHDFVDRFVRLALSQDLREKELERGDGKERYIFLEALAAETKDPVELRSQLLNILLAGRDTTASLLGWLFYNLARHPRIFKQLREVVIDTFGTYEDPQDVTFARLKSCQFLQHCNNETLRLYAVVPVNGREAVRDTTLPRGGGPDGESPVFVRKGQNVEYSVHAMHHRRDLWGPDVEEFKPERWQGRRVGWEYLPFNGGPRICLGRKCHCLPSVDYQD